MYNRIHKGEKLKLLSTLKKKDLFLVWVLFFICQYTFSQIEVNGSYTVSKLSEATGFGINLGYQLPFKNERMGIKPQIGYKCNCGYNDFVGVDTKNQIAELHTTFFYELGTKPNYRLIPNVGVNFRYNYWSSKMRPPLGTIPARVSVTGIRDKDFIVTSAPGNDFTELEFFTPGFTFQLQNQFKISDKLFINATPFIEVDYDINEQETGGGYIGVTYKR